MTSLVLAAVLLVGLGPSVAAEEERTYTVVAGDTLSGIARAHGFDDWRPIFDANRDQIANPNLIHIGQVLVIPDGGTVAAPAAPEPQAAPPPPPPPPATGGVAAQCGYRANWITDIIVEAAWRYGQSACAMLAVAWCESRFDPNAYNRSSAASGLFQFLPSTWRSTPYRGYSIFDPWASANAAGWMWTQGRRGEWVC